MDDFPMVYFPTLSESPFRFLVPFYSEEPAVKNYALLVASLSQKLDNGNNRELKKASFL